MHRITRLVALALGPLTLIAVAASARAAGPVPFTITEQINFATGVATFTATGPLCPSGTFIDDVKITAPNRESSGTESSGTLNLLIRTIYTCDDGSGTFNAQKHVFITFGDDSFTNTGPISLLGGTGAYTELVGHGVDNGTASGDSGVGQISGLVAQPPGT